MSSPISHSHVHAPHMLRSPWLVAAILTAGLAISLPIVLTDDATVSAPQSPAASQETVGPAPGVRYDGGPEEGIVGSSLSGVVGAVRYDGGPEEGSRGR